MNNAIGTEWVPRALPDLRVYERGAKTLCLNPDVPAWMVTTEASSLLLMLADGVRSVSSIQAMLQERFGIDPEHVRQFFEQARQNHFFDPPVQERTPTVWENRRLSAMHLHLTDRCNLQCTYCYRNSHPLIPVRHEAAKFIEMLEFIQPFCTPGFQVTFCGGEPLTFPGFRDVVRKSTELGYQNFLLTNGTLITDTVADFLAEHFGNVKISLDGPDALSHSQTRGDNFNSVMRGIHRVAERNVDLTVQVTVTAHNIHEISRFRSILPENAKCTFTPMLSMGRGADETAFISNEEFLEVNRTTSTEAESQKPLYHPGEVHRSCHAGLANLSIADTGDVYPCHLFHESRFHFGNIFHTPFEEIFYGSAIREYVESMDVLNNNPICRECEVRFLCGGGCKANALHATGDYRGVDLYCGFLKNTILDNLFTSAGA
jgi:radical SAM protein with 4Fe4S-binding SPASM domain